MNTKNQNPLSDGEGMENRLWDYIDGLSTSEEKSVIAKLIDSEIEWRNKYRELLEVNQLMQSAELEQPSMRFAKNVMEEIAKHHIAPATTSYINKKIVWGIGAFFIAMVIGLLIYSFGQVDWSTSGDSALNIDLNKVDLSKVYNNTYVNVFMGINVVLGLVLLDRYLTNKKNKALNNQSL